jgi:putative membrane protein
MDFLMDILDVAIYSCIGIVLMLLGNWLIDLIIPCSFPEEIKKGNKSVGFVSAGTNIGVGILLRSAISSPAGGAVHESLVSGLLSSAAYFIIGIAFFMLGYVVLNFFHKQYNLNDEIGNANTAAGIMVAGIFIGLAITISGVIL